MNDERIVAAKSTAEIETHLIWYPRGQFSLLVDDSSVAGLPFILFAGPVAEGVGRVGPEFPWQYQKNDILYLCVMTNSRDIPIPAGWTFLRQDRPDAETPYISIFCKRATDEETLTVTLLDPHERVMAHILAGRPQVRPEEQKPVSAKKAKGK